MPEYKYHPATNIIKELLDKNDCWYESFEHDPVKTSEEAAKVRTGYTLHQGAKAIIARVKVSAQNKKFIMIVVPGDHRFDTVKVKNIYKAKDVRFATIEEVAEITGGILPGGVPPFGNLFNLEVIADAQLLANEKIIFNAGDRSYSIGMLSSDYLKLVKPVVTSLTEDSYSTHASDSAGT